jgi:hypothetical protein
MPERALPSGVLPEVAGGDEAFLADCSFID